MIKRCIVSAFAHLRKTAVLDSKWTDNCVKGLFVLTACFAPKVADAQLTYSNWYEANNVKISALNECNSVYKIELMSRRDTKFALYKDGVNVNADNTVYASDVTGYGWETGVDAYGVWRTVGPDSPEATTLYLICGQTKDTISFTEPTYATVGLTGVGYQNMSLSSTPVFTATYCDAGGSDLPAGASFQWQVFTPDAPIWTDITGEVNSTFEPAPGTLEDSSLVRVQLNAGGTPVTSSSLLVYYNSPGVGINIEGTELFETVQRPSYEHEIVYGSSFFLTAEPLGASVISNGYKLYTRNDNDAEWELFKVVDDAASPLTITPDKNLEYKVVATCDDKRPGHDGESVEAEETFFVRVRFSWDEGSKVDTLFFDNFGVFPEENEYITFDGNAYTDQLVTLGNDTFMIDRYWAPDYFESVKNHKYSHLNPLVGPFSGDCAADDYKHYACWDNGGCDGYRIEDGYYAIVPNPDYSNCGRATKDYWNGYDHTNEPVGTLGGMLFINCEKGSEHTVLFEREITLKNECENTRLLFSAFVNNATAVWNNKPVNVRLIVRDSENNIIAETPSGNIYPRTLKGGLWANLSFMFNAAKGGKYKLQLVNNQAGGADDAGNDLLFDDILIIAAYPTVDVYRDRMKSSMTPVDTCQEVDVPLFVLNKDDIKKYITNPRFLYQYSKDSISWTNIGTICDEDSFVVSLKKTNEIYWDTTYFRGIVASNDAVIENILAGNAPELSCDSVYAVSDPFRVVFDYSGPVTEEFVDTLCVGETFSIKLPTFGRPKYRLVDSASGDTIDNMDSVFTYVVKATDPADTLFYYVLEQRLGCTDTVKIRVHRRLFVDFATPDSFITCLYDTPAQLTNLFPAEGATFTWRSGDYTAPTNTSSLIIPETLPQKGVFYVTGKAKDFCDSTKSFSYVIHDPVTVELVADRNDSLFCLSDPKLQFNLSATTLSGDPVTYYWTKNDVQVGMTKAPVNSFSFGELTEGKHVFGVKVVDEVCNKTDDNTGFEAKLPTELREPISIKISADADVCEDNTASASVVCEHLLVPDTTSIVWSVLSGNGQFKDNITKADAAMASSNVVLPSAVTATTEKILLQASVYDRVCTDNKPVDTVSVDMYKKLEIVFSTDRNDGLFCMADNANITFTANATRGEVKTYYWYVDDQLVDATGADKNTYDFAVTDEGTHVYKVAVVDSVCNVPGVSEQPASASIKSRLPITLALSADSAFCEGTTLPVSVQAQHLLDNNPVVMWGYQTNNVTLSEEKSALVDGQASVIATPVPVTNSVEDVIILAAINDEVCPQNSPAKSEPLVIRLHKNIQIRLDADGIADGVKCLNTDADAEIGLTITVDRGNPDYYVWSDQLQTTENTRSYTLVQGDNNISVLAYDAVCVKDGAAAEAATSVTTRKPLILNLAMTEGKNPSCLGEPVTLVAVIDPNGNPNDELNVAWVSQGVTPEFSANTVEIVYTGVVGDNKLVAYVQAANQICPAQSKDITLDVHDSISITISAPASVCQTQDSTEAVELKVDVLSGSPQGFKWSTGDVTELPSLTVYPTESAYYSVQALDNVCTNSAVVGLTQPVLVSKLFTLDVEALSHEVQMGTPVQLVSAIKEFPSTMNVTWMIVDEFGNSNVAGVVPVGPFENVINTNGTYQFYAVADGGFCGQIVSDMITIDVADFYQVPTAFTPYNANPKNNIFMKGYAVEIFNRYQQLVYEGEDGWNGEYNGKMADPGTYFYRLRKKDGRVLKGTIELVKF